jgi:hypothetical protein
MNHLKTLVKRRYIGRLMDKRIVGPGSQRTNSHNFSWKKMLEYNELWRIITNFNKNKLNLPWNVLMESCVQQIRSAAGPDHDNGKLINGGKNSRHFNT